MVMMVIFHSYVTLPEGKGCHDLFSALYIKALAEYINSMNVASCRHHVSNISGPGVNIKAIEIVSTLWL